MVNSNSMNGAWPEIWQSSEKRFEVLHIVIQLDLALTSRLSVQIHRQPQVCGHPVRMQANRRGVREEGERSTPWSKHATALHHSFPTCSRICIDRHCLQRALFHQARKQRST